MFNMYLFKKFSLYILYLAVPYVALVSSMELFNVKFVEQDQSRLVATSNYNYAITSPKLLLKNWRTVSVNGDTIMLVTQGGEKFLKTRVELGEADRLFVESLRDEIANSNTGFNHFSSMGGGSGGGMMISSSNSPGGGSSSFSSSTMGGFSSMTSGTGNGFSGSMQVNDLSVSMRDENNFSVSKSDFPFNWSRIFFNGDLVTLVSKDGTVEMLPVNLLEPTKLEVIERVKREVKQMQQMQAKQFSNTMQNSMNMISNMFSSIMGSFPKPPSFSSAVGNMFGNNFPFGTRNSPFNSPSWPFSGGSFAIAG